MRIKGFSQKESLQKVGNLVHGASSDGKLVAIPIGTFKGKNCSGSWLQPVSAPTAGRGCPNTMGLFSREMTSIPALPPDRLRAQVPPEKRKGPKIQWECGKHSQGKELRLYPTGNLPWQLLPWGRKAAVTGMTHWRAGKALLGAACAPWSPRDTRERCLMIFLSCSTFTGLRPTITFPLPRQRVGKAAAPRRNSCLASVPAVSQRKEPVPPAALPRCARLMRRAGSACRTWS